MANVRYEVKGIKELSRSLGEVDAGLPKELQKAFKKVAAHVIGTAQQRMPIVSGTAAKSLTPRATGRGSAGIAYPAGGPDSAGSKDGYYPWLDYGGTVGRSHGISRDRVKGGRYLYPAIADSKEYISDAVDDVLEELIKRADLETSGHA